MKIIDILKSPKANKRFRIIMDDGKIIDFGSNGQAFIHHKDIKKRNGYIARHFGNTIEKNLISNLIPSPSLMSMYILWN